MLGNFIHSYIFLFRWEKESVPGGSRRPRVGQLDPRVDLRRFAAAWYTSRYLSSAIKKHVETRLNFHKSTNPKIYVSRLATR